MTTDDATGGDAGGATTTMTMRARRGNTAANSVWSSMVRTRRASSRAMGRDGDGDGDAEARVGQRRARAVATRARGDGARGDGAYASGEFCTTFVRARGVREASRGARARAEGSDTTMRLGPREVGTEDGTIGTARDVADVADGGVDDVTCWMAFGDDDGSDACADAGATMGVCVVEATGGGAREASRRAGLIEDARGAVEAYEGAPLAFDEVRVCVCVCVCVCVFFSYERSCDSYVCATTTRETSESLARAREYILARCLVLSDGLTRLANSHFFTGYVCVTFFTFASARYHRGF